MRLRRVGNVSGEYNQDGISFMPKLIEACAATNLVVDEGAHVAGASASPRFETGR